MPLRTIAGTLVGAKRSAALTSWLATQIVFFDPVFEAAIQLLMRCTSVVWDSKVSLGLLQRAWATIHDRLIA